MRLRTQISLMRGTLVLAMGVFILSYFPAQREAAALKSLQQKAVTTSAIIARAAAAALDYYSIDPVSGNAELQKVVQIAREDTDVSYLQIFDSGGEQLPVHFGNLVDTEMFSNRTDLRTTTDSRILHIIMPVRIANYETSTGPGTADDRGRGELVGAIQMGFSLDRMQQQIRDERDVTILVVVIMILCVVLTSFVLSNVMLRPLEALEQVVYAFGQGDASKRAQTEGPHELSRLGAVFNQMADAVEQSSAAAQKKTIELTRANNARAEVESKFRKAFENAPIGMGMLDGDGGLFNTNPALRHMFWPESGAPSQINFSDILVGSDRERFTTLYEKLITSELDSLEERLSCTSVGGNVLQMVVHLSTVRSETDAFLYAVLQIQDVTESHRLTEQLEYQASYDELTGLLNRRSFESELAKALERANESNHFSYLMFMDLDQFKVVNDTSGHAAGDQLLREVSEILSDIVRANDTVCRLGGDEFGLILWQCPTNVAIKIAESVRASIESFQFRWGTETYRVGMSIGGLPIDPVTGDTSELQQLADAACYAAKEAGRNRVHIVSGDKDSARLHRGQVRWVQRLREAMDNNRFVIYGQLIKPLADDADEPERLEILLRLRDPENRKLIPPGAFLPAAERYGMSMELDRWVVKNLLDTIYVHEAFQADNRKYWVNLSGSSIGDRRFAEFLTDALEKSPLPPGTINFEITETAVIRSIVEARNLLTALNEMGCQIALDDFGSGLSSFGYLKKLPVDYLKIDGMFIRDILDDKTNRIFVKSIIDIAHALNIKTIAEFVENNEILEVVKDLGADYAQGFAIHKPCQLAPQFSRPDDADLMPALPKLLQV